MHGLRVCALVVIRVSCWWTTPSRLRPRQINCKLWRNVATSFWVTSGRVSYASRAGNHRLALPNNWDWPDMSRDHRGIGIWKATGRNVGISLDLACKWTTCSSRNRAPLSRILSLHLAKRIRILPRINLRYLWVLNVIYLSIFFVIFQFLIFA